ncbi:Glycosyl Hydrolase Family 88 [Pseudobythopirellula maris]|uniref:Glycosyl Hydrolase Family 88 n=1 Tax=Pseudobythopirellula maris TaxID=2527991 RepID=A0A5C5ZMU3_9BACT|nr:thioredoxin domain-containing protein [Pseudobythopirellula maris]TWT88490.1 Glycosyl Hydrolase Family 88 [Pseudobythopirellula maris]
MPNRLANESSPYLLQHQNNPVDWFPWGDEALKKARDENKPIFLSIGYSACHWCHVMEHESFENEKIAAYINEHFVPVKVDREERPDLDQIYMNAVQTLTGRGGWPMSVFLTPDQKPFYGGTYWPPTAGRGMPGFDQVLTAVNDAWTKRHEEVLGTADQLTARLDDIAQSAGGGDGPPLTHALLEGAVRQLEQEYDPEHGGFGPAPKFPASMDMALLLRMHAHTSRPALVDMVHHTLNQMANGGIYDHLGGGFARYSVDERWLVPHFEKMLYDNALLAGVLVDSYLATGDETHARVARETLDYTLRGMTAPAGGFYSTEDADSAPHDDPNGHKEEGLFYSWKPAEIRAILGEEAADRFCRVYDVTPLGNFEGRSILNLPKPIALCAEEFGVPAGELEKELAASRAKLFDAREKRPRPGLDDKVLTAWNGLMIEAMARAGAAFGEPRYVDAAGKAADFILTELRTDDGRLLHSWRGGSAKLDAYLDDYTAMADALVTLYEVTGDEQRIDQAAGLLDTVLADFADPDAGGFYYTATGHETLITRNKELTDNATPCGNSLAACALMRLGQLTGEARYLDAAHRTLEVSSLLMQRAPRAMGNMLAALDRQLGPSRELVLVGGGDDAKKIAGEIRRRYLPRCVLAMRTGEEYRSPLLAGAFEGKEAIGGEPTLYVCENHACQAPVAGAEAIRQTLSTLSPPPGGEG